MKKRNFYSRTLALLLSFAMVFTTVGWDGLAIRANAAEFDGTEQSTEDESFVTSEEFSEDISEEASEEISIEDSGAEATEEVASGTEENTEQESVASDEIIVSDELIMEEERLTLEGNKNYSGYLFSDSSSFETYKSSGNLTGCTYTEYEGDTIADVLSQIHTANEVASATDTNVLIRINCWLPGEESYYEDLVIPDSFANVYFDSALEQVELADEEGVKYELRCIYYREEEASDTQSIFAVQTGTDPIEYSEIAWNESTQMYEKVLDNLVWKKVIDEGYCFEYSNNPRGFNYRFQSISGDAVNHPDVYFCNGLNIEGLAVEPHDLVNSYTRQISMSNIANTYFGDDSYVIAAISADGGNAYFENFFRCNGIKGFDTAYFDSQTSNPCIINLGREDMIDGTIPVANENLEWNNIVANADALFVIESDTVTPPAIIVTGTFDGTLEGNHAIAEYIYMYADQEADYTGTQIYSFPSATTEEFAANFCSRNYEDGWYIDVEGKLQVMPEIIYEGYVFTDDTDYQNYIGDGDNEYWEDFWSAEKISGETLQDVLDVLETEGSDIKAVVYPIRNTDDQEEGNYEDIVIPSNIDTLVMGGFSEKQYRRIEDDGIEYSLYQFIYQDVDDRYIKVDGETPEDGIYYLFDESTGIADQTTPYTYEELKELYTERFSVDDFVLNFCEAYYSIVGRVKSIDFASNTTSIYFTGIQSANYEGWEATESDYGKTIEFKVEAASQNTIIMDSVGFYNTSLIANEANDAVMQITGYGLKTRNLKGFNICFEQTEECSAEVFIIEGGICDVNDVSFADDKSQGRFIFGRPNDMSAEEYTYAYLLDGEDNGENPRLVTIRGAVTPCSEGLLQQNGIAIYYEVCDGPQFGDQVVVLKDAATAAASATMLFFTELNYYLIDQNGCFQLNPENCAYRGVILSEAEYSNYINGGYSDDSTPAAKEMMDAFWEAKSDAWVYDEYVQGILDSLEDADGASKQYALVIAQNWQDDSQPESYEELQISSQWANVVLNSASEPEHRELENEIYDVFTVQYDDDDGKWTEEKYVILDDDDCRLILNDEHWDGDIFIPVELDSADHKKTIQELETIYADKNVHFRGIQDCYYNYLLSGIKIEEGSTVFVNGRIKGIWNDSSEKREVLIEQTFDKTITRDPYASELIFSNTDMEGDLFENKPDTEIDTTLNLYVQTYFCADSIDVLGNVVITDENNRGESEPRLEIREGLLAARQVITDQEVTIRVDNFKKVEFNGSELGEITGHVFFEYDGADLEPFSEGDTIIVLSGTESDADIVDHYYYRDSKNNWKNWAIDAKGQAKEIVYRILSLTEEGYDEQYDDWDDNNVIGTYYGSELQSLLNQAAAAGAQYVRVEKNTETEEILDELIVPESIKKINFDLGGYREMYSDPAYQDGKEFPVYVIEEFAEPNKYVIQPDDTVEEYIVIRIDGDESFIPDYDNIQSQDEFAASNFGDSYISYPMNLSTLKVSNANTEVMIRSEIVTTDSEAPTVEDNTFTIAWPSENAAGRLIIAYNSQKSYIKSVVSGDDGTNGMKTAGTLSFTEGYTEMAGLAGFTNVELPHDLFICTFERTYTGSAFVTDFGANTILSEMSYVGIEAPEVDGALDDISSYVPTIGNIVYTTGYELEHWNIVSEDKFMPVYYLTNAAPIEDRYKIDDTEENVDEIAYVCIDDQYYPVSADGNVDKTKPSNYTATDFVTRPNKLILRYCPDAAECRRNEYLAVGTKVMNLLDENDVDKINFFGSKRDAKYITEEGKIAKYQYNMYEFDDEAAYTTYEQENYIDNMRVFADMDYNCIGGDDINELLQQAAADQAENVLVSISKDMTEASGVTVPSGIKNVMIEAVYEWDDIEKLNSQVDVKINSLTLLDKQTNVFLRRLNISATEVEEFTVTFAAKDSTGIVEFGDAFVDNEKDADAGVKVYVNAADETEAQKSDVDFMTGNIRFRYYNVIKELHGVKNFEFEGGCLLFTEGYNTVDFSNITLIEGEGLPRNEIVYVGYDPLAVPTFGTIDDSSYAGEEYDKLLLKYVNFKEVQGEYEEEWPSIEMASYMYHVNEVNASEIQDKLYVQIPTGCLTNSAGQLWAAYLVGDSSLDVTFSYSDAIDQKQSDTVTLDIAEGYTDQIATIDQSKYVLSTDRYSLTAGNTIAACTKAEINGGGLLELTFEIAKKQLSADVYLWYINDDGTKMNSGNIRINNKITNTVQSVSVPILIECENGITLDDIMELLPKKADVVTQNPTVTQVDVDWTTSQSYNPLQADAQYLLFTGILSDKSNSGIVIPNNLGTVMCTVNVAGKPFDVNDIQVSQPSGTYTEELQVDISLAEGSGAETIYGLKNGSEEPELFPDSIVISETTKYELYIPAKVADGSGIILRPASEKLVLNYVIAYDNYNMDVERIPVQTYTGSAIKPVVKVFDGSKELVLNKDYTVTYVNNVEAADALDDIAPTAIIKGKGNYSAEIKVPFTIDKKDIKDTVITIPYDTYMVDANNSYDLSKTIKSIKYGNKTLKLDKDYTLEYCNAEDILNSLESSVVSYSDSGSNDYKIMVIGKGNYKNHADIDVTISNRIPLDTAKVSLDKTKVTFDLTKNPIVCEKPQIKSITVNGKKVDTKYYSVDYLGSYDMSENTQKLGVFISAKDDVDLGEENPYTGSIYVTYEASKLSINKAKFALTDAGKTLSYTGEPVRLDFEGEASSTATLKYNDYVLVEGRDFTTTYTKNLNAGTATVVITARDDSVFTGSLKKTFKIGKPSISDADKTIAEGFTVRVADMNNLSASTITAADDGTMLTSIMNKAGVTQNIAVYYKDYQLTEGIDYKVKYSNNKAISKTDSLGAVAKPATITISCMGNFSGSLTGKKDVVDGLTIKILPKDMNANSMSYEIGNVVYKAGAKTVYKPSVVVMDEESKLTANKDYTFTCEYDNSAIELDPQTKMPSDVTQATVTITGKGNYAGSIEKTFLIIPMSFDKLNFKIADQTYHAGNVELDSEDITIKINAKSQTSLTASDYAIIDYEKNDRAGTAKVTLKGTGIYKGQKTVSFKINRAVMNNDTVNGIFNAEGGLDEDAEFGTSPTYEMEKAGVKPLVELNYYTDPLEAGTDYKITYKNNKQLSAGLADKKKPMVVITGTGNYTGSISATFEIVKKKLGDASDTSGYTFASDIICVTPEVVYTSEGKKVTAKPVIKQNGTALKEGTDYTIVYGAMGNTLGNLETDLNGMPKVNWVEFTITGKGLYEGEVHQSLKVVPNLMKNLTIKIADQTYNAGDPVTIQKSDVTITGKYKEGSVTKEYTLSEDQFEIVEDSYSNNTKVGTAKVTIQATPDPDLSGDYHFAGSKVVTFKIVANQFGKTY